MATADRPSTGAPAGYVDIYLLPVLEQRLEPYAEQASTFGATAREHGALRYREFRGDDLGGGFSAPPGRLLTAAVAEFESRAHRDEVMGKVMADPRIVAMMDNESLADMDRMQYGGFATLVDP